MSIEFKSDLEFVPAYWMSERTGLLREAIGAYLTSDLPMTVEQIAYMRAYLRQWINAPVWCGVDDLRAGIDGLVTKEAIDAWLSDAIDIGIDPL